MEMRILKIESVNIRGPRKLAINFEQSANQPYPVSLIMMPNGVGKTTTMMLLRAVLDGSAAGWKPDEVRNLRPPGTSDRFGEFHVTLLINGKYCRVGLHLDYQQGEASYTTARTGASGGEDVGLQLPDVPKKVLESGLVRRFVFDGELVKSLLDSKQDEAIKAIKYLYGLHQFENLSATIERLVQEEQQRKNSTAKTQQGLTMLETQRDKLASTLKELERQKQDALHKKEENEERYRQVEEQCNQRLKDDQNMGERIKGLEKRRGDLAEHIRSTTMGLLDQMRDPYALGPAIADRLQALHGSMQKLQLPKTTAREFFVELATAELCVCGNKLGDQERRHINAHAQEYLADDQVGVMNEIKSVVRDRTFIGQVHTVVKGLRGYMAERSQINRQWDALEAERVQAGDTELESLRQEQADLKKSIHRLQEELTRLTTEDEREQQSRRLHHDQNIPLCKVKLQQRERELAEATGTVEFRAQASRVQAYIKQVVDETLKRLKAKIISDTNKKLARIIETEPIAIEAIEPHLVLKDKGGGSEGQSLAIAYSFLGSMFESSLYSLPFVVDSPAGSLDRHVRRHVAAILPKLFQQLIIFITSSERGAFAEGFYELDKPVQFVTVSKKPDTDADCSYDLASFKAFQGADEETLIGRAKDVV